MLVSHCGSEAWQGDVATVVGVGDDLSLEPHDLIAQSGDRVFEGDVLFLQTADLRLQAPDALLLALLAALRRLTVLRPLQLELSGLGVVEVRIQKRSLPRRRR